jgi:hypothetical protein
MKMMKKLLGFGLIACALSACGSSGKEEYQFVENGCDTGKHEFKADSQAEATSQMCTALQDDKLNNSCAEDLRRNEFAGKCSGTFTPKY